MYYYIISMETTEINPFNLDIETSNSVIQNYDNILIEVSTSINNGHMTNENNESNNLNDSDSESETDKEPEIDVNVLKKMVIRWITLDDNIKEYNKEVKDLKSEKTQLEEKILTFMNKNEQNEIPVKDGKLEKKKSETKEPINEEYIKKCLIKSVDDIVLVDKLTSIILNSREITESYKLARKVTGKAPKQTKPKTKKN
jgi:hypothetical protein